MLASTSGYAGRGSEREQIEGKGRAHGDYVEGN